MKGDSVMSNVDEIIIMNQNQAKKIKFLQKQKKNYEKHIKDLRQTLSLNKQSLSLLAFQNKDQAIQKLNQQNIKLHTLVRHYYDQSLNHSATLLIEQQLRNQQKKFYQQRLVEYENTINQLRKYLQDKQDSFSAIVLRLRKYEDLNQVMLGSKLQKYKRQLKDSPFDSIIKQISEQRDKYKQIVQQFKINMEDMVFLKGCLQQQKKYLEMRQSYIKMHEDQEQNRVKKDEKYSGIIQKTKNTTNSTFNVSSPQKKKNPDSQIIRLLKKQKLNNQILQQSLNNALQNNQELVQEINVLIQNNIKFEETIEKLQSKIVLLQFQLSRFDTCFKQKYNRKSKCDIDRPKPDWLMNFQYRGDQQQVYIQSLKQDVQKLTTFILTCIPSKSKIHRSLSSHNFDNKKQTKLEEEQIMEQGQLQIEEI